jgi:hypothetical protein
VGPVKCPSNVRRIHFMPRARKQTTNVVVAPEVSVPQVLITRDQYFQDIQVRWQIHQYEVNKLREDVVKFTQTVSPYVKQVLNFVNQQLSARRVAV